MKKSSQPTQTSASTIAPSTVATGAKGCGSERAAGSAALQYEKVPRKTPSVRCVTRSLEKLTMMRGENCIDARVSVISRMANTIDTTVIMEAAMPARMTWATCGSACEGNRAVGTQALAAGNSSSSHDRHAPAPPSVSAMISGRIRKPPRRLYVAWRNINGRLLVTISSSVADQTRAHKEEQRVPPSCSIQRTGFAKGIETLPPYTRPCPPISRLQGQACGVCREKNIDQGLQPPALGGDAVRVPHLDRRLEARDLRIGELEVLRRDGERGIPHYTLLSSDHLAFQFECLLLIGIQGYLVLH